MPSGLTLLVCRGGRIVLPHRSLVLVGRQDGGNLVVVPARDVWERSELSAAELTAWSFLVAATGRAMLDVLPQLEGGCINYWEAGNWALNEQAEPEGPKTAREHRSVHMHLLGRSRFATDPSWRWGEAPRFPDFVDRFAWAARFERLTPEECVRVVAEATTRLERDYELPHSDIALIAICHQCGYPKVGDGDDAESACTECRGR